MAALAAAEVILHGRERRSTLTKSASGKGIPLPFDTASLGSLSFDEELDDEDRRIENGHESNVSPRTATLKPSRNKFIQIASQIPAVVIVSVSALLFIIVSPILDSNLSLD